MKFKYLRCRRSVLKNWSLRQKNGKLNWQPWMRLKIFLHHLVFSIVLIERDREKTKKDRSSDNQWGSRSSSVRRARHNESVLLTPYSVFACFFWSKIFSATRRVSIRSKGTLYVGCWKSFCNLVLPVAPTFYYYHIHKIRRF